MCPRRMFLLLSVSSNYHKSGHKKPQLVILLLVLWPLAAEGREGEHASTSMIWTDSSSLNLVHHIPSFVRISHRIGPALKQLRIARTIKIAKWLTTKPLVNPLKSKPEHPLLAVPSITPNWSLFQTKHESNLSETTRVTNQFESQAPRNCWARCGAACGI